MNRVFFLFFLLLFSCAVSGQKLIKGIVIDSSKNKPIPNASIFLSNTSKGTKANEEGKFELHIPSGKYDLIVSSIGYETFNATIIGTEQPDFITIRLNPKAEEMETVFIEPYEKNGWATWGKFFSESFIGTTDFAKSCEIKNPEVIRFRHIKSKQMLMAYAFEPLIIENSALGYRIHYQLESFNYNFNNRYLVYSGYPFFEPMKGGGGKEKRWMKNRKEAYYGSMMHFMRAVYVNKLVEEGFEIRALQRIWNKEKIRVKEVMDSVRANRTPGGIIVISKREKDSGDYYREVLKQDDYKDFLDKNILPTDSIAYAVNTTTAALDFKGYLQIVYKKKMAPPEYRVQNYSSAMLSQLTLIDDRAIEIQANGNYYDPTDIVVTGFWAWSEKISMLLPYNYQPPKE